VSMTHFLKLNDWTVTFADRRHFYKERHYRPTNASWNRLIAVLNRLLEDTGVEFEDITKAKLSVTL
jgi:hypothetical protein